MNLIGVECPQRMEKEVCRPAVAPLTLPDLNLSVSYEDALHYAQGRLRMFGSGNIKPFCEAQQLTYTNVIGLKNNTLKVP